MKLHELISIKRRKKKKLGRGYGSGKGGHTVGRGTKGQKARSGKSIPVGFEGGQVPLYKKIPKKSGFRNPTSKDVISVPLARLNIFKNGEEVIPQSLVEKGFFKKLPKDDVKILAVGNLHKKIKLKGFKFSAKAKELIEKSGSEILK
ncbi:50S ribosomal protein L15 [Patescibacteria group bacterium]